MRSTSYKFTSHGSSYASPSHTSQSSSSGLPSYFSRPSSVGNHSATDYGTKRFLSSTSTTSSSMDQNVASFDYGQLGLKSSNAANRSSTANRSLSLTTPAREHRNTEIVADKSTQRPLKKQKDNGSLVTVSQLVGGRNLKAMSENNKSALQNSALGVGDDQNKIQGSDRNVNSAYSRTSMDSDSSMARSLQPFSDDYRRAPLRRQSAVSAESFEAMSNASATPYRDAPVQRANSASYTSIVEQQIFLKRLLQAHNLVDDMLRSRGMNPDDERNYLRFLQQVPESREEEKGCSQVLRSPSASGSDSGLSLDNESDQSIDVEYTPPAMPSEENISVENTFAGDDQEQLAESILLCKKLFYRANSLTAKLPKKSKTKYLKVNLAKGKLKQQQNFSSDERSEAATAETRHSQKTIPQRTMEALFQQRKRARCSAEISIQHVSFYQVAQSVAEQKPVVEKIVKIHFRLTQRHCAAAKTTMRLPQVRLTLRAELNVKSSEIRSQKYSAKTIDGLQLGGGSSPSSLRKTIPAHVRKKSTSSRVRIPENFLKTLNPTSEAIRTRQPHDSDEALRHARDSLKRVAFNHTISTVAPDKSEVSKATESVNDAARVSEKQCSENQSSRTETIMVGMGSKELPVKQKKQTAVDTSLKAKSPYIHTLNKAEAKPCSFSKATREEIKVCKEAKKSQEKGDNGKRDVTKNEKHTVRRALTCIDENEVRKALQKAKTSEATDVTLVNEFRRNKVIPAPQAIIRAEMPQIVAAPNRILNIKPVRDFVEPLPPPRFLRRRTPERFLLETTLRNQGVSNKFESNEVVLRPVKRILKAISTSNSTKPVVPHLQLQQVQPQSCSTTKTPFGVHLKRVDRHAIENRPRGAITQSTAKKPWIPKWRRVERSEQEDVEEEEQAEAHEETREYNERGSTCERASSVSTSKREREGERNDERGRKSNASDTTTTSMHGNLESAHRISKRCLLPAC